MTVKELCDRYDLTEYERELVLCYLFALRVRSLYKALFEA